MSPACLLVSALCSPYPQSTYPPYPRQCPVLPSTNTIYLPPLSSPQWRCCLKCRGIRPAGSSGPRRPTEPQPCILPCILPCSPSPRLDPDLTLTCGSPSETRPSTPSMIGHSEYAEPCPPPCLDPFPSPCPSPCPSPLRHLALAPLP